MGDNENRETIGRSSSSERLLCSVLEKTMRGPYVFGRFDKSSNDDNGLRRRFVYRLFGRTREETSRSEVGSGVTCWVKLQSMFAKLTNECSWFLHREPGWSFLACPPESAITRSRPLNDPLLSPLLEWEHQKGRNSKAKKVQLEVTVMVAIQRRGNSNRETEDEDRKWQAARQTLASFHKFKLNFEHDAKGAKSCKTRPAVDRDTASTLWGRHSKKSQDWR